MATPFCPPKTLLILQLFLLMTAKGNVNHPSVPPSAPPSAPPPMPLPASSSAPPPDPSSAPPPDPSSAPPPDPSSAPPPDPSSAPLPDPSSEPPPDPSSAQPPDPSSAPPPDPSSAQPPAPPSGPSSGPQSALPAGRSLSPPSTPVEAGRRAPEDMWSLLGLGLGVAVESVLSEVETKLDGMQAKLVERLVGLTGSLDFVQAELTEKEVDQAKQTDNLVTELDRVKEDMAANVTEVAERLEETNKELVARLQRMEELLTRPGPPRDCSDLPEGSKSGVYLVRPVLGNAVAAYCDMKTAGGNWTVIQRREDIEPRQDFFAGWYAYKWGLGKLDGEFWWGLEHMWLTTSLLDREYELRIDLEDFKGEKRYALYDGFRLSSEGTGYRLTAGNYTGNAGDSLRTHIGKKFSTKDRDNDPHWAHCAEVFKGGWWYSRCHSANLNGRYLSGNHTSHGDGINWATWTGIHYSLKTVSMKIRPSRKL